MSTTYGLVLTCVTTQDGHYLLRVKKGAQTLVVASLTAKAEGASVSLRQERAGWVLA